MEIKIPIRDAGESDLDYVMRYGHEVQQYTKALVRRMDAQIIGVAYSDGGPANIEGNTSREKELRSRKTIHDYLSEHPALISAMRKGDFEI